MTSDEVMQGKRKAHAVLATSVSLAGTALSIPILGSVDFDLISFNEVSQSHETINNIHAQIIDSCIAVIISRPVIPLENQASEASDNSDNESKVCRCMITG